MLAEKPWICSEKNSGPAIEITILPEMNSLSGVLPSQSAGSASSSSNFSMLRCFETLKPDEHCPRSTEEFDVGL